MRKLVLLSSSWLITRNLFHEEGNEPTIALVRSRTLDRGQKWIQVPGSGVSRAVAVLFLADVRLVLDSSGCAGHKPIRL